MRKFFSSSFWHSVLYKFLGVFASWLYAAPGLIASYFPYIFMYQVLKGTAEDSALTLTFSKSTSGPALSKATSIYTWDNDMYVQLSYDGTTYSPTIEIPQGRFFHFSQSARKARVVNKTAGLTARFQLIAWYIVSKY